MADDQKPADGTSSTAPVDGKPADQKPDPSQSAAKPDGDQKPADQKPADAPKPPDKYEFKANGADGKPVELDAESIKVFEPVLKEAGVTQDQLTKLLPAFHAELARQDKVISDLYMAQRESWETQAKSDKDFGGNRYQENVQVAQAALARFGSPALKDLLNETGLGNHVEVLKFFEKVGRQISEDKPTTTQQASATTPDAAAAKLFNHPTSQVMT